MNEQQSAGDRSVAPSAKRSISSLVETLSKPELERLAVDVILQNRRYLEHAQALYERLHSEDLHEEDSGQLYHDYHLALINLNGHHQVVSAVIAALGYVPAIPGEPPPESETSSLN